MHLTYRCKLCLSVLESSDTELFSTGAMHLVNFHNASTESHIDVTVIGNVFELVHATILLKPP